MANESSGIDTSRLEAFSDGVFAIAISLLIVEVHRYLAATLASFRSAELGLAINGALVLMYWFTPRAPLTATGA